MNNEVREALAHIPEEMESYAEISKLVASGQYDKALSKVKESRLSSSTKNHLEMILASADKYVIDRHFGELNARIAQALCWDCWRD